MALPETTKIEIKNGCWIRVHNVTCNLPVSFAIGSSEFVSNIRHQQNAIDEGDDEYQSVLSALIDFVMLVTVVGNEIYRGIGDGFVNQVIYLLSPT